MIKKIDVENLNLQEIADSGQCFRMNRLDDGSFLAIAGERCCKLKQISEWQIEIKLQKEQDLAFWEDYFHLDYDYKSVVERLLSEGDDFLKEAVNFGKGLRILRQESFETLISFIISQNKNIPAIKSAIEKLSENYGEKIVWDEEDLVLYGFPGPKTLAKVATSDLRAMGLGYRDEYVKKASMAVASGEFKLAELSKLDTKSLMNELMTIKGVGKKVASCVALFGFGKMDAVPVDVWIDRVNKDIYGGSFNWEAYGEVAGLVQQYLFYFIRNK